MPVLTWVTEDAEGDEEIIQFPAKWAICGRCDGNGTHDHPAFSNGITAEQRAEWDDDEWDGYMRGNYDVRCDECDGSGKVVEIDEDACTGELADQLKRYDRQQRFEEAYRRECEAERRMGA